MQVSICARSLGLGRLPLYEHNPGQATTELKSPGLARITSGSTIIRTGITSC